MEHLGTQIRIPALTRKWCVVHPNMLGCRCIEEDEQSIDAPLQISTAVPEVQRQNLALLHYQPNSVMCYRTQNRGVVHVYDWIVAMLATIRICLVLFLFLFISDLAPATSFRHQVPEPSHMEGESILNQSSKTLEFHTIAYQACSLCPSLQETIEITPFQISIWHVTLLYSMYSAFVFYAMCVFLLIVCFVDIYIFAAYVVSHHQIASHRLPIQTGVYSNPSCSAIKQLVDSAPLLFWRSRHCCSYKVEKNIMSRITFWDIGPPKCTCVTAADSRPSLVCNTDIVPMMIIL